MTFYQELQLNQAGSKAYIASFQDPREKLKHIGIYIFKIILNIAFSVAFITGFTLLFGPENGITGLVVLLCVQLFRFSDLGIRASHGAAGILILFGIFAVGPKLASLVPTGWAFCVNLVCIFFILLLGCHNIKLCNHSILVLSYLLLQGYDVSGHAYRMRLAGLLAGGIATAVVLYHNHRKAVCPCTLQSIFQSFSLSSERTRWQLRFAFGLSSVLLIAALLGLSKAVWAGIAAMSVFLPARDALVSRVKFRAPANLLGSALFLALYFLLPKSAHAWLGIIGGFAQGLSATYGWQTAFNTIGALSIAAPVLGVPGAIFYRVINNALGSVYVWLFDPLFDRLLLLVHRRKARGC